MTSLIDSHCHLDFEIFDDDIDAVLTRAHENNISDIIIPGVQADTWSRILFMCSHYPGLHACYGIHPYTVATHTTDDLNTLRQWLITNPAIAVGECGLDYRQGQADRALQKTFFDAQLMIALELELPVVIHSVHATEDVIDLLKSRRGLTGMVHSYSGSYEQALQLIDMGFYISFGGAITYERASKLRKTASRLPLESILIETDAPDQPDMLHKGERNEPAYLANVLKCLCDIREENRADIVTQTSANARSLFNF